MESEAQDCGAARSVIIDSSEAQLHVAAQQGPLLRIAHNWTDATATSHNGSAHNAAALVAAAPDSKRQ